jgi:hypothetical protein
MSTLEGVLVEINISMFIDNKYYSWYKNIIKSAQSRATVPDSYYEVHHIIPRCLGGNDQPENLAKLTAREHFICHWLLTKFVNAQKQKINFALWSMMNLENEHQQRYKITSRKYQLLKENLTDTFKTFLGKTHTAEARQKISQSRKALIANGTIKVNENKEKYKIISQKRKGHTLSDETKAKIGNAHKGKTISEEQKAYLSQLNKGKPKSESARKKLSNTLKEQYASGNRQLTNEAKEKIRKANTGKIVSNETKEKLSKINKGRTWILENGKRKWIDDN